MIDADDDLPVLTQILRTGTARPVALIRGEAHGDRAEAPVEARHDEALDKILDDARDDTAPMADELVIGHDPHFPHPVTGADAFALPQDHVHDHRQDDRARSFTFDEPDFVVTPTSSAEPLSPLSFDVEDAVPAFDVSPIQVAPVVVPEPVEDPAAVAERIRDAVLRDLSTRIGRELDARIAQALHAEVETALGRMQYNLRNHLADALRDVVERAVADRMRASAGTPGEADPD